MGNPESNHLNDERPYTNFLRLATNLQAGDIDFAASPKSADLENTDLSKIDWEKLIAEKPLNTANSVSSRITSFGTAEKTGQHKVVIDLDMDAALVPSSTFGHHHLLIDKALTWDQYQFLLTALMHVGIIEIGYYNACMSRKASWIRTPWTRK